VVHLDHAGLTGAIAEPAFAANPTDDWAVGEALRLGGDAVAVFVVAPEHADPILRSYVAAGADEGIRLWAPELDGTDDLARATVVTAATRHWSADVILCGSRIGETGTRVLGPMVAELLDVPQVTSAVQIELDGVDLLTQRRVDGFVETVQCPVPAVVTVDRGRPLPYPTLPNRIRARTTSIEVWGLDHLGLAAEAIPRSPLEVIAVATPKPRRKAIVDLRPAMERTFDLLLGGGGGSGGGAILDGALPDTADKVVARCLAVLAKA
jgi:electron transfer flavoprotein beta subunit